MSIEDALAGRSILVTGGTGSFGQTFVRTVLERFSPRRIVVFSRDEFKQLQMRTSFPNEDRIRFFLGDVRDRDRLMRAFDGVDVVVHAAALKQVPAVEDNPFEAVQTNIGGAQNVIDAAIDRNVERVIALSTDKASSPINLYGATKLVSDKLFIDGNTYAGARDTRFSVIRYGNVAGSRGSVVRLFRECAPTGVLPITDARMTRFWITLEQSIRFVLDRLADMRGGELFVPKLPSVKLAELARVIAPAAEWRMIGIRPGEKLHEELISADDGRRARDAGRFYVLEPEADWWHGGWEQWPLVAEDFRYSSETNAEWVGGEDLRRLLRDVGS